MKWLTMSMTLLVVVAMPAPAAGAAARGSASLQVAQASGYQSDITTGRTSMTDAQAAKYQAEYQATKAQYAAMTPQQRAAVLASARDKKLKDLSMIELVGQRDDMKREIAAQSDELKMQAAAARTQWIRMTPAQKQAARKSAWEKKRAELDGIEQAGQRDDTYVLPW